MRSVKENFDVVSEKIEKACIRSGRQATEIQLLGVCKGQPVQKIVELHNCGVR